MRSKITKIIPIILSLLILTSGCKPNIAKMPQDEAAKHLLSLSSEYYALHTHESSTLNISLSGELYGNQINTLMTQTVNATTLYKDQGNFSKLVNTHTERSNNENQTDDDIIDYTEGYSNGILFTSRDTQAESLPVNLKYQLTPSEYSDYRDNLNKDDPDIDLLVCGISPSVEKASDSWVISYNNISQEAKNALEQWALTTILDGIPTNITLTSISVVYTFNKKIEAVTNTKANLTFTTCGDSGISLDLVINVNADLSLPESTELDVLPENLDDFTPCDSPDAMITVLDGIKELQNLDDLKFRSDVVMTLKYKSMTASIYAESSEVEFDHSNGNLTYNISSLISNTTYGGITNNTQTYNIATNYDGQIKTVIIDGEQHSTEYQSQWSALSFIREFLDPYGISSSDVTGITYYPVDSGTHLVMLEYDATSEVTKLLDSLGFESYEITYSLGVMSVDLDKELNITNIQYELIGVTDDGYSVSYVTNISYFSVTNPPNGNGGTIM